jgi:hypothetical protein
MIDLIDTCKQTFAQIVGVMAPMDVDEAAPALFAQCSFALVCSDNFPADAAQKVCLSQVPHTFPLTGTSLPPP